MLRNVQHASTDSLGLNPGTLEPTTDDLSCNVEIRGVQLRVSGHERNDRDGIVAVLSIHCGRHVINTKREYV